MNGGSRFVSSWKLPSELLEVPTKVPFITTLTPTRASEVLTSEICPVITVDCAFNSAGTSICPAKKQEIF